MRFSIRTFIQLLMVFALVGAVGFSQSASGSEQNSPPLLLPQPQHVEGQVIGEDGNPVAKVRLFHIKGPADLVTDSNGRFSFDTVAPAFVAQRPGFQSAFIRTNDAQNLQIVLRKIAGLTSFPVCSDASLSDRTPGWGGIFQIPQTPGAKVSREVMDVDYWRRMIQLQSGTATIQALQGRGFMWGGGDPQDESVWRSIRYSERTYELGDRLLTDAKWWLPNGKCSREVGLFSESVYYSDIDCDIVEPLDRMLDGLCVVPDASKHLNP